MYDVLCMEVAHQQSWITRMTTSVIAGPATCTSSLLKARFVGPMLRRQSVDKVPLASDENRKLGMLKTQWRLSGAGTLMRPSRLTY